MKGFYIHVKNDLLEAKHVENMGVAVWLYMWLLDGMTSVNENGVGKVKGGRPISSIELQVELGISDKTYRRWLHVLETAGYISTVRAPYGVVITVKKAKKLFGKSSVTNAVSSVRNVQSSVRSDRRNIDNTRQSKTIGKFVQKQETRSTESVVKERMRDLREQGLSFKQIAERLKDG